MPNPLGEFEARLGKIVEGTFGAVFRSTVQPAELARAASKEMTRSRKLGLDKMYVANVYFVFISPKDAKAMGDLAATIEGELETYLLAFARERDYSFVTRPVVRFTVDEGLKRQGKFDIVGQQMTAEAIFDELGNVPGVTDGMESDHHHGSRTSSREQAPADDPFEEDFILSTPLPDAMPDIFKDKSAPDAWADALVAVATTPPPPVTTDPPAAAPAPVPDMPAVPTPPPAPTPIAPQPVAPPPANVPAAAVVTAPVAPMSAHAPEPTVIYVGSVILPGQSEMQLDQNKIYTIGRQESCDLSISDANISRRHAELFWDGEGWSVRDLGSTNGTRINGHKIQGDVELHNNDNIEMGMSTIAYHETSMMG